MKSLFMWLGANIWTIIICAVLIAIVTLVIVYMISEKKKGKSSCGCNCSSCAMKCHENKK